MSEVAHIPQLRFPEFEGSWSSVSILGTTNPELKYGIVDGPFGSNLKTIHYKKSGIPIITSGYVTDGFFNVDSYLYVTEEKFNKEKRSAVNSGDIVMAKIGARCGSSAILPKNHPTGILSGNALKITVDNNSHSTNFIWQILWSLYQGHKLDLLRTVGAQPAISIANLKKYKLSLPTKPEQQKIAAFLTEVDTKIEQLGKKQELLGEYKKGLMQKIFTQGIRFSSKGTSSQAQGEIDDGSEFPDWEEKKLGDFDDLIHGDGDWILSQDITKNGKYEIVQLGNIGSGLFVDKPMKTISEDKFIEINGTQIIKGDLLINRMVDNNLYCCLLREDGDFITSVDVCWIRESEYFDNYFLMNLILFGKNQNKLLNLSSGSGRVRISKKNLFNKFSFELPCLKEQTKIANFLSSIDNKIEQVGEQLDKSKQFKKALLQQMFV